MTRKEAKEIAKRLAVIEPEGVGTAKQVWTSIVHSVWVAIERNTKLDLQQWVEMCKFENQTSI